MDLLIGAKIDKIHPYIRSLFKHVWTSQKYWLGFENLEILRDWDDLKPIKSV